MKARYTKLKSTGLLLEHQSGGDESNPQHLQTLIDNAISSGHNKEDIEAGYEDVEVVHGWLKDANEATKTYADKRKAEYPPMEDYLDGLVKGNQAQIDKYISDCLAVKQRYPKNDGGDK